MAREVRTLEGDGPGLTTMVRAALPVVPGVNQLPGVRRTGTDLPDVEVRRESVPVRRDHVTAYSRVCGFPAKDTVPLTYLHVLAFPLHMALMTDRAFPFPAIGTVHLENEITRTRPVRVGESVSLAARAENLRPHAKGRAFDMVVSASTDGEEVWSSTSTYLRLGGGDREHGEPGTAFEQVPAGGATWRLGADLGRRYAAVSGDHNPIHLYPLTARAFGFRRQIAHGMWTKARAVAALENRLPDAVSVAVAFKKPIFLPGSVTFGARSTPAGIGFVVASAKDAVPHLLGEVRLS
jgi:acyl dehydratase